MLGQLHPPEGKALETAKIVFQTRHPMACNTALGCSNNCTYCYGATYKRYGLTMGEVRLPKRPPVELITKQLKKGLKPEGVFFSFFTDPFLVGVEKLTEDAIKYLLDQDIPVATLSKMGASNYSKNVRTGFTIVSNCNKFSQLYEPNALPIMQRLKLLKELGKQKYYTWVSVEPFPPPSMYKQDLPSLIKRLVNAKTDLLIFGKLNYDERGRDVTFYKETVEQFTELCESYGVRYAIKIHTLNFINK